MSVQPSELTSEVWTRWQGHLVNGVFPLGRYLGCSDHSGVFLTKSAARPSEVAIKLLPATRSLAESLLPRWKRAGGLAHPHVLRLFEWGGCQLDGLPYLYAVMEYADQTLAQLLEHRALTEGEAHEMLLPTLDALGFLHGRNLVQGQLKPANILVVGDQLKLASDTIRSDGKMSAGTPSVYDAPEARHGSGSTAGDVWGLGVTLLEALARRPLPGLGESREAPVLPADFSPVFRYVVTRCLSPDPQDRPSMSELTTWAHGHAAVSAPAAAIQPVTSVAPQNTLEQDTPEKDAREQDAPEQDAPEQDAPEQDTFEQNTPEQTTLEPALPPTAPPTVPPRVAPNSVRFMPSMGRLYTPRALVTAMLCAAVILALGWTGLRLLRSRAPVAPPPPVQVPAGSPAQTPGGVAPGAAAPRAPASGVSTTRQSPSEPTGSPAAIHEVIPDVSRTARRSIRGHIKVWVRVIVDPDGSVFAAVADRTGPSGYFQRLAIEAAKKWTFAPVDTQSRRVMQVRFDFSRDGTTGHVVSVH